MSEENWAEAADQQENLSKKVENLQIQKDLNKGDAQQIVTKEGTEKSDENYEKPLSQEENSLLRKMLRDKLVQNNQELQVQQRDPGSPLYSVKSFEELHLRKELLDGIYSMGFNRPSKIQETALPLLLANPPENMIAQSQSGTGKTAAFVLTMLSRIDTDKRYPQCLCLSPTYELALQTGKAVETMGKFLPDLQVGYAVRGNRVPKNTKISAQIVIGTPGTTLDWTRNRAFELPKIEVFVLDEADVMIDTQGFKDQSIRLHRQLSRNCQLLFFSATYDEDVMKFAQHIVRNPNLIRLRRDEETLDNIKQYYVKCVNMEKKYESLTNLYGVLSVGQAIIFCHTRKTASWLAKKMCDEKFVVAQLSGDLDVAQRAAILRRFKEAKERVLVTTNVCSRGIDVEQVTLVVNFDLPIDMQRRADCETYLHRIGRTGRFGKSGVAINFVSNEQDIRVMKDIEDHFGIKVNRLDTDDYTDMEEKLGDD
ncbi:ATP-dependent RNA helicase DDX19A-like [Clavelina lepadiformis]|uniref:ATP-dependent RNA helicase DDX19A-like n=1 Tax=Clavelina lepadiformis TaxID=159417 RepID=UPI0040419170